MLSSQTSTTFRINVIFLGEKSHPKNSSGSSKRVRCRTSESEVATRKEQFKILRGSKSLNEFAIPREHSKKTVTAYRRKWEERLETAKRANRQIKNGTKENHLESSLTKDFVCSKYSMADIDLFFCFAFQIEEEDKMKREGPDSDCPTAWPLNEAKKTGNNWNKFLSPNNSCFVWRMASIEGDRLKREWRNHSNGRLLLRERTFRCDGPGSVQKPTGRKIQFYPASRFTSNKYGTAIEVYLSPCIYRAPFPHEEYTV